MGYAFISYSSKNQASADAMRNLLQKKYIEIWMAPYDIPAGSEYAEVLYDALSNCSCLVLLLTDNAQNSPWVKKEVNIAISEGKTIIPVKLEDVELNRSMKLYLQDQQIVPVHILDEESEEIQKVLKSVIAQTGLIIEEKENESMVLTIEDNLNPETIIEDESPIDRGIFNIEESTLEKTDFLSIESTDLDDEIPDTSALFVTTHSKDFVIEDGVLKKYNGNGGGITLPGCIVEIGEESFKGCDKITSVIVPDSVTKIGKMAFEGCLNLKSINLSKNILSIGFAAFKDCTSLTSITLPEGIQRLDDGVFVNCSRITSITIPKSIQEIGNAAFSYCRSLKRVILPAGLTMLGELLFNNCEKLQTIIIPDSVKTIKSSAFEGCSLLKEVAIPKNVREIEDSAFKGCKNLILNVYAESPAEKYAVYHKIKSRVVPRNKGRLSGNIKAIIDIDRKDCDNPIDISMPGGSIKIFDYCDEFVVSAQKQYIVVRQKIKDEEYLFFVFRNRNGEKRFISAGQDQQIVYRRFIEKNRREYVFTDKETATPNKEKLKHFAQDTAIKYFKSENEIPQVLTIPGKYNVISSNVFEKLHINDKEIRQIIIPSSVEVIEESAFAGLVVTDAVFISDKVRKIGDNAFTLKKGAYIYCKENSKAFNLFSRETDFTLVKDISFRSNGHVDINEILNDLSKEKEATRIKTGTFHFSMPIPVIDEIIVPNCIHILEEEAFRYAKIRKRVVIPSSVAMIGKKAFELMPDAYVECDKKSYAYLYCKENGIRNSVDISYYKSKGLCSYCGSRFEGLFKKKCCQCGMEKNY